MGMHRIGLELGFSIIWQFGLFFLMTHLPRIRLEWELERSGSQDYLCCLIVLYSSQYEHPR